MRRVAVLAFHKIGPPPKGGWDTWNYIGVERFTAYLEALREACYHVIDLSTFLRGMQEPKTLPERTALLTFDDGYRSMLSVAQPILNRFGHPSVLFVPSDHVGGTNSWDYGNEPEETLCDWDELRELSHRGVSIQSHSVSHRAFADLDVGSQDYEIARSKVRFEEQLDTAIEAFAFPYGDCGEHVDAMEAAMVRAGYRAAFVYKGGVCELPSATPFRLSRVPMGPDTNLRKWLGGAA